MHIALSILQVALALTLLNVWLLNFNKGTAFRGGNAHSMPEEFAAYGLPAWSTYLVGFLKVGAALCLIAGLWFPSLVLPAAVLIGLLMIGAVAMHIKIHDPLKKSVPALVLLALCILIALGSRHSGLGA